MTSSRSGPAVASVLDLVSTVAIVITCGFLVWFLFTASQRASAPKREVRLLTDPVDVSDSPHLGDSSVGNVLLVYSDFVCPFCARFGQNNLPVLRQEYVTPGRLQIVFRNLPLTTIHPTATKAAVAAECAAKFGHFWEMHDQLFSHQSEFDETHFAQWTGHIGLTEAQYQSCSEPALAKEITARIDADSSEAKSMGINSTPSFVFGRRQADGRVHLVKALQVGADRLPDELNRLMR